jgi:streptopain
MRDVGQNIGMNYGCDGSGAWPNDAANSLRSDFGYESANYRSSFSWKEYRSELYSRFPVMLVGYNEKNESCFLWWCSTSYSGGHAWVGDGYRYRRYSSGNEYRYAHMNWGWDGSSNGWYYLTGSWNSFKYKKQMVTDIRP